MVVDVAKEPSPHVFGLLGGPFFSDKVAEFDLAKGVIRLFSAKDCASGSLAYWTNTPSVAEATPDQPFVFGAAINGKAARALLDPARSFSVVYGLPDGTDGVIVEHGVKVEADAAARLLSDDDAALGSVSVGEETIQHAKIRILHPKVVLRAVTGARLSAPLTPDPTLVLGADFMKAHRLLYAPSQHLLYMTYAGGPVYQLTGPAAP